MKNLNLIILTSSLLALSPSLLGCNFIERTFRILEVSSVYGLKGKSVSKGSLYSKRNYSTGKTPLEETYKYYEERN